MTIIHRSAAAVGLAALCAVGLGAQSQETQTTTKTKIEVKGGKDVTVTGCVERRANGDFLLRETHADRRLSDTRYMLVTNENLVKNLGQRVEVKGKAVVDGDGKLSVESKTKTEVDNGKDQESTTKTEATSGELDLMYLGVTSMKVIATSCN